MQATVQSTNLSSETLNRIDRLAAILSDCKWDSQQLEKALVSMAELGYYDGKSDTYDRVNALLSKQPESLPGEYAGASISNGQIGGEVH